MADGQTLTVHLLGGFRIATGHEKVTGLDQARLQRLLAYLLLHRRAPRSRQQIAFTLWPDTPDEQALKNLRTLLTRLRQALPDVDRFLDTSTYALRWRLDSPFSLDVADFEAACAQAADQRRHPAEAIAALETAVRLYGGDLLPGWYDEWLAPERERLRQAYLDTLERLAALLEEKHHHKEALGYAQRLVRADPLHEAVYRQLMLLHLALGDRASALRVYHTCATILRHELGVDPGPATQAVYQRVLTIDSGPPQPAAGPTLPPQGAVGAAMVGRQAQWDALLAAWRKAAKGQAQAVLISGEAGIGKTRLAEELLAKLDRQGIETAVAHCYAEGGPSVAYGPVAEWLRSSAVQARMRWLDGVWLGETARLLPELLSIRPDLPAPGPITESWQRQRFFRAVTRAVLGDETGDQPGVIVADRTTPPLGSELEASRPSDRDLPVTVSPLLLFLDDLQWCDQETLDWLGYLVRSEPRAPLLILGTIRDHDVDAGHPLTGLRLTLARSGILIEIHVPPLNEAETAQMAAGAAGRELSVDEAERLYRDTEGNPLYIVETMLAQSKDETTHLGYLPSNASPATASSQALPQKVQAVIQYRLSQATPNAQTLAQTAAVVGREFTYDVLARVTGQADDSLTQALDELWRRQIVRERGAQAYDFSHDKFREVAYSLIGAARRRLLHGRIAEALVSLHELDLDSASTQIANHFERAGYSAEAYLWHLRAGRHAQVANAPETAIWHYQKALLFLPLEDKGHHQIELYERLGALQRIRAHFAQAQEAYEQMYLAAELAGDVAAQTKALIGVAQVQDSEADYQGSLESAQRVERLVSMIGAPAQAELAIALSIQGLAYYRLGMAEDALRLANAALAVSDALGSKGRRQKARSLNLLGAIHTMLGNHERARADREQALVLFREVGDHVWIGHILNNLGEVARHRGNYHEALPYYQEALTVAERIGNLEGEAVYRCNLGGALTRLDHHEAAVVELRKALAVSEIGYWVSEAYSFLAEALLRQGRADEALQAGLAALESGRQTYGREALGIAWRVIGKIIAKREEWATIDDVQVDPIACFSESERILAEIGAETERLDTLREWAQYDAAQGVASMIAPAEPSARKTLAP